MFIGREKELDELRSELNNWKHKTAVLVYGKRRVGKSTLINKAADSFDGTVINHLCVSSTYEGNMDLLYQSVCTALSLPKMSFESVFAMMDYLKSLQKRILLIIDEYPYLKETKKKGEVDSVMQAVIDKLPENVKIILCGSYIAVMKELLDEDNPLFGRFSLILHVRDFDYFDAAKFYPELPEREKAAMYSVFGGSPYVLSLIDDKAPLDINIKKLLLPETGLVRTHIENTMLREIKKTYDTRILEALGNGKKKYSEIHAWMKSDENGLLDKQLKILLDMETITKDEPINKRGDKKKQFYEITDNLMRFYFTFIFGNAGTIARIGSEQFYKQNCGEKLREFVSRRFEGIVLEYFHRAAVNGEIDDIEDFGSYWYDDPVNKTNGEFDCVVKRSGDNYDFYECKYFDREMTPEECEQEEKKLASVQGINISKIGFVSIEGFSEDKIKDYILIDGKKLYR
jgi:AAA+ ATPase superfamily predicted ATPase